MKLSSFLVSCVVLLSLFTCHPVWSNPISTEKADNYTATVFNASSPAPDNADTNSSDTSTDKNVDTESYRLIRLHESNAEVFRIPTRRPYTNYEAGMAREFIPVRIIPGDTLCIFEKFFHFFNLAAELDVIPADLLRNAILTSNGTDYYFYDPEDLCIQIEDELNIDVYQYDCSRMGMCQCGLYYGYVDPNVPQPEPINQTRTYVAVNGLNRNLVVEDEVCVSGMIGHCTLEKSTSLEKLYCKSTLECVLDDTYGELLTNEVTHETYGICLPKARLAPSGDNFRQEDYRRIIDAE